MLTTAEGRSSVSPLPRVFMDVTIELAGIPLRIALAYDNYRFAFAPFATQAAPLAYVGIPAQELQRRLRYYAQPPSMGYVECMELCPLVSDALLPFRRVVFHSLAFAWHGKVWLLTAPSGTGKTTHYLLWKLLCGDAVQILNGDKPVLEVPETGSILVHPSPWYGKEGMQQHFSGSLGGIVLLEQGTDNRICRLSPQDAAASLFAQFLFSCQDEQQVRAVAAVEETMLRTVPVWHLINCGDADAARLCRAALETEAEKS